MGKTPEQVVDTCTENIGSGGICIILDDSFELFEDVALEIFIDDEKPLICTGTVVWVVKKHPVGKVQKVSFDTGIEFLNISQEDKKKIVRLVEKLLSSST